MNGLQDMTQDMNKDIVRITAMRARIVLTVLILLLTGGNAAAQVTVNGSVFGGGNEADVQVNTNVNITSSTATVQGNVYGGGNKGSVGTYTTSSDMKTFTFTGNTGICTVAISGGTIGTGVDMNTDGTFDNGNVYGAGKGEDDTYWCEKAMVYKTNVTIEAGTVNGTVYGGGQIGRVENDAKVTIGVETPANNTVSPQIIGNVFGAGAGKKTHGYSALLRGNTEVTVQGYAQVGLSVYGGGENASVGRFKIVGGLPSEPENGGTCKVTIQGHAKIGTSGTDHNVYGSCRGVQAPSTFTAFDKNYKSMQTDDNKPDGDEHTAWEYIKEYGNNYTGQKYIWEYYPTLNAYQGFLNTLALTSHTDVEVGGSASVYGSVFGGGQNGITLGHVDVDITGGTIYQDVYGGGALADTNKGNLTAEKYDVATVTVGETVVTGMYERSGNGTAQSPFKYTLTEDTNAVEGKTYYTKASQSSINTTTVNLTGGLIKGDAYGGGLGQKTGFSSAASDIEATVYGDIAVTLNGTKFDINYYEETGYRDVVKSGRVFGCNNLLGSPQGNVTVTVNKTVAGNVTRTAADANNPSVPQTGTNVTPKYELAAVYGGGNLAPYNANNKKASVRINGCGNTSIETVYGGGNAAAVPETDVLVWGCYEIGTVFGGGNGKDKYKIGDGAWTANPGANVGKTVAGESIGSGNAKTILQGGYIHEAYGGSNSKGTISGNITIKKQDGGECAVKVDHIYGAGKDADVEGDLVLDLGCSTTRTEEVYGCAKNANVKGNVDVIITSGEYGKVFGGNNVSGAIFGHIKVHIEETGCTPIIIDELYGCGNDAAYSVYGYYQDGTIEGTDKPKYVARTSMSDGTAVTFGLPSATDDHTKPPYADPEVNIVSCTRIGKVFGGGLGSNATVYGNPIVNINQIYGKAYDSGNNYIATATTLGRIGVDKSNSSEDCGVFGGGNEATVEGNTTVNVGNLEYVELVSFPKTDVRGYYTRSESDGSYYLVEGDAAVAATDNTSYYKKVLGANILSNVYGGGNKAEVGRYHEVYNETTKETTDVIDVEGNTYVNICAVEGTGGSYTSVPFTANAVTIGGKVFGGGKGIADSFRCGKAMVTGGTNVHIGNGTIGNATTGGSVYGGGEVGRVEGNAVVMIGLTPETNETSAPHILGNVFGAGSGVKTHGYSALLRGKTEVTIQSDAKVDSCVYGGGEIASVGRFKVKTPSSTDAPSWLPIGMPYSLWDETTESGKCTVIVQGSAEIGPDNMTMTAAGGPVNTGHVFGAGKGVTPDVYAYISETTMPKRMMAYDATRYKDSYGTDEETIIWEYVSDTDHANVWEYFDTEAKYLTFVETMALVNKTDVTIDGDAFVKGSVYGGSENGQVKHDTYVKIKSGQIGEGTGMTTRYGDVFIDPATTAVTTSLATCATWTYEDNGYTYDKFAGENGNYTYTGKYSVIPTADQLTSSEGGRPTATDGHTFYGNVFGGGSGYYPYAPGKWHSKAGIVGGNTQVDIEGGHILSNVYGGNEQTDVGSYTTDTNGAPHIEQGGTCRVNMMGGTVGVPRTKEDIAAKPVIGNLFGAGKGDKRVLFNTKTNVKETFVNVTGGIVYGSVFGGGEDGHVIEDATTKIEEASGKTITIGSTGESGADGNVFGGGRGSETALTAGVVGGNVILTINSGTILGSVYGGGRLASVGTNFVNPNNTDLYGKLQDDDATKHGNITININNGTIGTVNTTGIGGNIYGGSKGTTAHFDLGIVRSTTINMTGGTAYASVYGGGELAQVVGSHTTSGQTLGTEINISGGTIGTAKSNLPEGTTYGATYGNVYGGGKGNTTHVEAGLIKTNTKVSISQANNKTTLIRHNIYGGGAYGSVGTFTYYGETTEYATEYDKYKVGGTAPDAEKLAALEAKKNDITGWTSGGTAFIAISDGTIGEDGHENGMIFGSSRGDIGAPGEIHDKLAWVYDTEVTVNDGQINGSIYGGGENGHVYHDAAVNVHGGTIGMTTTPAADTSDDLSNDYDGANYPYRGNVYGGGCGTDKYYTTTTGVANPHDGNGNKYNPLAGIVYGDVTVIIDGGHVVHNVYGAGAMGSVGTITNFDDLDDATKNYKHDDETTDEHKSLYNFGLSWPYEFTYGNTGLTKVTIKDNAVIGVDGSTGGHVYGAARGSVNVGETDITKQRYEEAKLANVREAQVVIGTEGGSSTTTTPTIHGSVYGGGEDGHVNENASVTIHHGTIAHSVFGGGKGTSTYTTTLWDPDKAEETDDDNKKKASSEPVHSWTAGKVYGNTTITMNGGSVGYSIYGGGNMASVGKGNYAGGSDDYSTIGYGELGSKNNDGTGGPIWTSTSNTDYAYSFLHSGLATVNIYGGIVGAATTTYGDLPTGNVFGSSRGVAALSCNFSPRYKYVPDFFLGYVNETSVTIGKSDGETTPTIYGSVYGGGENGHVRRSTEVIINKGTIGVENDATANKLDRGNVFGAGSGVGKNSADAYNTSSGSVTCTTTVTVNNGTIYQNVYGGGAQGSVGPPPGGITPDETNSESSAHKTYTKVEIKGGNIGSTNNAAGYGGNVYGASRGNASLNAAVYATDVWSTVNVINGIINGNVFGGGESGIVKCGVVVNVSGGTIAKDVYGGGALADTQTSNWDATKNEGAGGWADGKTSASNTTTVRLTGGIVGGKAYGGGLGEANNPAYVYGDVLVDLNGTTTMDNTTGKPTTTGTMTENTAGCVVEQVFGANNVNGTPKGDVMVHVYATRNKEKTTIAEKFRYEDESLDKLDITETTKETDEDYVARLKAVLADKIEIAEALSISVSDENKALCNDDGATADNLKTTITGITTSINNKTTAEINAVRYDVKAVYGGGNQATYNPLSPNTSTTSTPNGPQTQVIIEGCDYTSIETVYGGGNAAAVPETNVEIKEAYEILNVFGGGNGKDAPAPGVENPGADVGTRDNGTSKYGTGNANSLLEGGHIHEVYGGSNQKGIIKGSINQTSNPDASVCELVISKVVGAGKYADIDGDVNMILGCQPSKKVDLLFAGADEANVNGNISLTITNGNFGKVFGGNNLGGAVKGKITVNVEETGCQPIRIDELYLGGNEAAYSVYGYYESEDVHKVTGKKILKPRTAEMHAITDQTAEGYKAPVTNPTPDATHTFPYAQPELNIISCTYIGKVFGGGYGEGAKMYANPTVNVNQIKGTPNGVTSSSLGTIGEVYGGGNAAKVIGNTTVNIGTAETVTMITVPDDPNTTDVNENQPTVLGANITGNVYGGGNLADVTGNTFVNICAKYDSETKKYVAVDEGTEGVTIGGTVYGGGRGQEDTFLCEKAMIGENGLGADNPDYPNGNTSVRIGHGTVNGSVYGGGQVGRVEMNTVVEIGFGDGGSGSKSPVIEGYVFGAGAGVKTHGYSALVRGNTNVTIAGNTWVKKSVYGGGEIASVARYKVAQSDAEGAPYGVYKGEPYLLENPNSGYCYVTVKGHAKIGTDGMKMYHKENGTISSEDKPDDWGHVFAAGKGVLPDTYNFNNFTAADRKNYPKRMALYDSEKYKSTEEEVTWEYVDPAHKETNKNIWEYFNTEAKYFTFIQTLGLATQTEATIDGNALVNGSVYGGSENGLVQFDTNVTIDGDCQIGVAEGEGKPDCAHWEFKAPYEPYDPYAKYLNDGEGGDGLYYYDEDHSKSAAGGAKIATDGHTYYGNVFGGGSGSVPYFNTLEGKSEYLSNAGTVKGNTYVTISGGHILTNVYGGCEATNVLGTANVTMTAGTVGVERTDEQIIALPLTGYIFGGGKGDQRIFFNKETNVNHSIVKVEGGRIYGSVYGGGEDGHVLGNVTMTIGKTGDTGPTIGTQGTSYYDGNVFGGGRGFGGEALTAGNVGGAVTLDILGGQILGSVYGGGRLASVGYGLYLSTGDEAANYGKMRADDEYDGSYPNPSTEDASDFYNKGRGNISVTVSGGTIGNDVENAEYGGNVFGGSMGRLTKLDGSAFDSADHWSLLATAKKTTVNVTGGTIKRSVYGGGEMGTVTTNATVNVSGGTIGTSGKGGVEFGNVYGGGKGYVDPAGSDYITAGIIKGNTAVTISNTLADEAYADAHEGVSEGDPIGGPTIYHSVYGGGAYGSLGTFTYYGESSEYSTNYNKYKPGGSEANATKLAELVARKYEITGYTSGGKADVIITGGTIGTNGKENGMVFGSSRGDVDRPGAIQDRLAWVHDTHVVIGTSGQGTTISTPLIKGSVYGSGENGHTYQNTIVDVHSGTIGIASGGDITDNNGTPNDEEDDITYSGAEYPYRGNVYGGGCGTDKYYDDPTGIANPYDGNGDTFNPLAGIVYGTATVNIDGGLVVHNVYGAGAMGSVGRTVTTTDNDVTTTTISGGTTTINISGGTIGVDGTNGDGNVFGAARGDENAIINQAALVKKNTNVSITGGTIEGNVYGGGELGCVGTFTVSDDMRTFTWQDTAGDDNTAANSDNKNTGICNVTVNGSSAVINGHVYGAGKGKEDTFWCEKGIAYSTNVNISNGTVNGNVYGGGEVGRVETDSQVKIGLAPEEEGGKSEPSINGSVFGGGAGVETHGYSALVRGNTTVIVDEDAHVSHSVYGGGEIASVGRYGLDEHDMPSILQGGGYCYVTVQGNAEIGEDVFGAGKGVTPAYRYAVSESYDDRMNNSKRMVPYSPYNEETHKGHKTDEEKKTWDYFEQYPTDYSGIKFVWEYFKEASDYSTYLETLALATHPEVTIDGDATVSGSVFGGGELGLTKGSVIVNIQGGTIAEDVYGGGSLANTNTTSLVDLDGDGKTETVHPTTMVNLSGGTINRNVYGGGLGQLAKAAVTYQAAVPYADVDEYNTDKGTSLTAEQFEALSDAEKTKTPAVAAQAAVTAVEAKVYGNVSVNLNEPTTPGDDSTYGNCVVKGTIFGCNNLNGSPQSLVTVHIYKTEGYDENHTKDSNKGNSKFDLKAVYGGGNLAAYYPDDATARETAKANVIIEGCQLTSIGSVYGGGNAASVPATEVTVNSAYEIGEVFGGGNGKDNVSYDGGVTMVKNPGANVGYRNYSEWNAQGEVVDASDADTKEKREAYAYGVGKTHATIYGGTVHKVYGGSNTRGNVRVEARTTLEDALQCTFNVGEAYGGGNNAPMDGDAVLEIGCISGMEKAYGGAANADVNGNVVLNITNGTYGQVFGGNDQGGAIRGSITVNIEETGCRPIIIGELYGGGCEAAYSVYGYNDDGSVKTSGNNPVPDPVLNVKSFTSIGKIFGGGYGSRAKMVGNPTVNINVVKGRYRDTVIDEGARVIGSEKKETSDNGYDATAGFAIPSHDADAIGAIGSVFGGGNEAEVIGNPTVNIGTEAGDEVYEPVTATITPGTTSVADYYILTASYLQATGTAVEGTKYYSKNGNDYVEVTTNVGDDVTSYYTRTEGYSAASGTAEDGTTYFEKKTVAVDIRDNVFGGGNNAPVTGNTNVVIGKKKVTTP